MRKKLKISSEQKMALLKDSKSMTLKEIAEKYSISISYTQSIIGKRVKNTKTYTLEENANFCQICGAEYIKKWGKQICDKEECRIERKRRNGARHDKKPEVKEKKNEYLKQYRRDKALSTENLIGKYGALE